MKPTIMRSPNPRAPKELGQFAFLAGEWDCNSLQLQESGRYTETKAHWIGTYTLNGYAFQDDYVVPYGAGLGTTWRSYNTKQNRWVNRWLQAGTDTSSHFTNDWFYGNFVDGEMQLQGTGHNARGSYEDRILFKNITEISFVWTLSRSYDKGNSWVEDLYINEANRRL